MAEELEQPQNILPSDTPSDPPAPSSSPPGDHPSEPLSLEALSAQMQELRGDKAESADRLHKLELENARLQGQLQGGGQPQQASFAFNTPEEYQLALQNYQLQGQQLEQDSAEFAQLRQMDANVRGDYNRFLQHRQVGQDETRQREISRAAFLASRQIDPESETARTIEVLHENEVPFEQIEEQFLGPQAELARLRGVDQGQQQQTAAMQAATSIEGGQQHVRPPAPVGRQTLTPDQFASSDLERRMANRAPDLEQALFGETEFVE